MGQVIMVILKRAKKNGLCPYIGIDVHRSKLTTATIFYQLCISLLSVATVCYKLLHTGAGQCLEQRKI